MNLNMIVMIKESAASDLAGRVGIIVATDTRSKKGTAGQMCKVRIGDMLSDWLPWDSIELLRC